MDLNNSNKCWQVSGRRRQGYSEWKNAENHEELDTWFNVKDPVDIMEVTYYGIYDII